MTFPVIVHPFGLFTHALATPLELLGDSDESHPE
jgi:hypothetical protein